METPILWPPDAKSWLICKDPDAGKDWWQEEKGTTEDEMVGWHHRLNGHGFGWTPAVGDGQRGLACCGSWGRRARHDWATELNFSIVSKNSSSNPGSCRFSLASRSFIILHLNRHIIYFELIFVESLCMRIFFFTHGYTTDPALFVERLLFL